MKKKLHNENIIIEKISKQVFFNFLEKHGFNQESLKSIFDNKRISSIQQNKFNIALRVINNDYKISLIECVIFLEEKFIGFKKILSILDDDILYLLKKEMSQEYNIKLKENGLLDILDF